jgi:hypothetical protein
MSLTSTTEPTTYGLAGSGGITSFANIVFTYPLAASASVSAGDWVKLSSTTAGTIAKCSATNDTPIGVAFATVDNTSGAAGALYCGVVVKGVVYADAIVNASGNTGTIINFNDAMYLAGTLNAASAGAAEGQALSSTTTSNGTGILGRSLDRVAIPSTSAVYKIRVYINELDKGLAL